MVAVVPGRVRLRFPALRGHGDAASVAEAFLATLPGVRSARAYRRKGSLVVSFDPEVVAIDDLVEAITARLPAGTAPAFGFGRSSAKGGSAQQRARRDRPTGRRRCGAAGRGHPSVGAAPGDDAVGPRPHHRHSGDHHHRVSILEGRQFFSGGGHSGSDALVTLATLASLALRENVVALVVLWLLNVGELIETSTLRRTERAIEDLLVLGHDLVWLVTPEGVEVQVPLEELQPGDVVAVYEQTLIPVDGTVMSGEAVVNQAAVTGESRPAHKSHGDTVFAGTAVVRGSLRLHAEAVGSETAVGRIIAQVAQARADRAPIETLATRFSRRFVPVSLGLAGLTWLASGDPRRAMTMMLIACPCAAGLSTPTAVSAAIGNGARRGILIKGGSRLEGAGRVTAVVFDKTGTLTIGHPLVTAVAAFAYGWTPDRILAYAASTEIHARHPLADAILRHTRGLGITIPEHDECEPLLGFGMRAALGADRLLLGSTRLMERFQISIPDDAREQTRRLHSNADTPVCLAWNGQLVGLLGIADTVRPEAAETLVKTSGPRHRATGDAHRRTTTKRPPRWPGASPSPDPQLVLGEELRPPLRVETLQGERHLVAMVGGRHQRRPRPGCGRHRHLAMGLSSTDVAIETAGHRPGREPPSQRRRHRRPRTPDAADRPAELCRGHRGQHPRGSGGHNRHAQPDAGGRAPQRLQRRRGPEQRPARRIPPVAHTGGSEQPEFAASPRQGTLE